MRRSWIECEQCHSLAADLPSDDPRPHPEKKITLWLLPMRMKCVVSIYGSARQNGVALLAMVYGFKCSS